MSQITRLIPGFSLLLFTDANKFVVLVNLDFKVARDTIGRKKFSDGARRESDAPAIMALHLDVSDLPLIIGLVLIDREFQFELNIVTVAGLIFT